MHSTPLHLLTIVRIVTCEAQHDIQLDQGTPFLGWCTKRRLQGVRPVCPRVTKVRPATAIKKDRCLKCSGRDLDLSM